MEMKDIGEFLLAVWEVPGVKFILSHIVINVVFAIAAAVHTGTFELARVGEFLVTKVLPYVAVYYTIVLLGEAAGVAYLAPLIFAVIEATLTGDLADSLDRLGLPMPDKVVAFVRKREG